MELTKMQKGLLKYEMDDMKRFNHLLELKGFTLELRRFRGDHKQRYNEMGVPLRYGVYQKFPDKPAKCIASGLDPLDAVDNIFQSNNDYVNQYRQELGALRNTWLRGL